MLKKYKNLLLSEIKLANLDVLLFYSDEQVPMTKEQPAKINLSFWLRVREFLKDVSLFQTEAGEETAPTESAQPVLTIGLKDSGLVFLIRDSINSFDVFDFSYSRFTPGFPNPGWSLKMDWSHVREVFIRWLEGDVRDYIHEKELPDEWAQLDAYKSFVDSSPSLDNSGEDTTPFTDEEKEYVRDSVENFRTMIAEEFKPTPEQSEFISERLEYLSRAADRLNRFDWNGLAISVVVSIAVNLSVDTERGRLLYTLFKAAFQTTTKLLH